MSKPEMRRLRKYFHKHFSETYLSKFKRMLLPKREDQSPGILSVLSDEKQDKPPIKIPNKHMIPTDAIIVNKELGVGEFGIVQQGVWTNDGERIQVAIKCLSRERMQNNPIEFLKEAAIMHAIDHENIVRLYGVVLDTDSLMLVTELAPLRSLLECLKEPSLRASFPILSLCDFAIQIANGMQYLEAKRLIHRDLAARNILVFSKNKVKISDFGLSRALGVGKDYYQTNFNVNLKLPIAWCAPECISYLKFTSSSDVWAYGVTLWEMFSYGFQPWAALTGHQILEAIDEPNFQRLEQPECCPKDYFSLMQQCWHHEPGKRPRFSELVQFLPDLKPEQVQAVQDNVETGQLFYRQGDIITVLDKGMINLFWKGVLSNGKTGIFNPAHTITYLGSNLPSNKPSEFIRGDGKSAYASQRRKIRMDMISSPQGDLKHTGHVGLDGAYFGDISFLGGKYPCVPRQIVTPYKPQEDFTDQCMLQNLMQGSKSSGTYQDCSRVNSNGHSSQDEHNTHDDLWTDSSAEVPSLDICIKPDIHVPGNTSTIENTDHEYHEISDEEAQNNVLKFDKPLDFDFGPSLLDEMDQMFRTLGASTSPSSLGRMTSTEHESSNAKNEIREIQAKQGNKKKQATVKPISAADQRTLYSAIAMAQELTARSMTDLESPTETPHTPASPTRRRKFSFKLPHQHSPKPDRRHFSDEAASIPDIQATLSAEAKEVYNSLVETQIMGSAKETNPLRMLRSGMPVMKSRVQGKKNPDLGNITCETNAMSELSGNTLLFDEHHIDFQYLQKLNGISTFNQSLRLSPVHSLERHKSLFGIENEPINSSADENPIPLPPRDRSKTLQPKSNLPRHRRKHPLIIPGNGVSRAFSKMTMRSTHDQIDGKISLNESDSETMTAKNYMGIYKPNVSSNSPEEFEQHIDSELAALDALAPGIDRVTSNMLEFSENLTESTMNDNRFMNFHCDIGDRTPLPIDGEVGDILKRIPSRFSLPKLNQSNFQFSGCEPLRAPKFPFNNTQLSMEKCSRIATTVVPSINSVIGIDESKIDMNIVSGGDVRQELILDEHETNVVQISSNYAITNRETQTRDLSRHSDHVSCEDLLEFACDGPNSHRTRGPHNGKQSDEVRIMMKVLHAHSTPESCVAALNSTDWDILAAIKVERLRELLERENNGATLEDCKVILRQCGGDISKAAASLRNIDDSAYV